MFVPCVRNDDNNKYAARLIVLLMDVDVDECADGNNDDICSYRCRNIDGGFFCQCPADGPPTPSAFCVGRSPVCVDCFAIRDSLVTS